MVSTKDQEIVVLANKIKVYEDENRRLTDINRTLEITKNEKINNLSRIPDMDSHGKSQWAGKSIQKENYNPNIHIVDQLETEKEKNHKLQTQIERLRN